MVPSAKFLVLLAPPNSPCFVDCDDFAVLLEPDMSDIAANAYPIAFGDWRRAYRVVDRVSMVVLRDPYPEPFEARRKRANGLRLS